MFSFKNQAENEPERLVADLLFFKKALCKVKKQVTCSLISYILIILNLGMQ